MKLITFIMVASLSTVSAMTYSQTVTLNEKNISVGEVLKLIEKQTGYHFLYDKQDISKAGTINVNVSNVSVRIALDKCFNNQPLSYKIFNNTIVIKGNENNVRETFRDVVVRGTVKDSKGETLPGVSVKLKGTTTGVTTDMGGNFSLKIAENSGTLVFTYIGFTTKEIALDGRTTVDVTLVEEATALNEVVFVGYGSVKKSDITGAVSSITADDLGDRQATSVANLIQGRASGVEVSRGKIRVRGVTTFNNTDPLVVIDGFLDGDLSTVNPNDIENIEVLKDASSTAIYGSRGANGVILVTTKAGKEGPMKVNVNLWSGLKSASNRRDVLNASQYIDYVHDALTNAGQRIPDKLLSDAVRTDVTDWQDEGFQTGLTTEANVSLSGGTDKARYFLSIGHRYDENIVVGPQSSSTYLRYKNNFDVKPWLNLGANVALSYNSNKGASPGLMGMLGYMPYQGIYDAAQIGGFTDVDRINDASDMSNPLSAAYRVHPVTHRLPYQAQLSLKVTPLKGLSLTVQPGVKGHYQRFSQWTDEYISASNQTVNQMAASSSYLFSPIIESFLNYSKTVKNHNFSGLLGNTWQSGVVGGGLNVSATGYASNEIKVLGVASNPNPATQDVFIDSRLSYFGRFNYDFKSKYLLTFNLRADASPNFSPTNRWGKFPSLSLAWKINEESFLRDNKLVSQLKLRAGWGRSGNDAIGQYRYQSSVFTQGSAYPLGVTQSYAQAATVVQNIAPDIRWETTESLTFGLDYGLFNDAITGTVEYFEKKTNDILFAVPSPLSLGYGSGTRGGAIDGNAIVNAASVINKGFEFQLNNRGKFGKVGYGVNANYTYMTNNVTSLGLGQPFLSGVSRTTSGQPIGYFYGYVADGVFKTKAEIDGANAAAKSKGFDYFQETGTSAGDVKFKDLDGDGRITASDRTNIGNPIPKHAFGLNVTLDYGNFDFNMFWQGLGDVAMFSDSYKWVNGGVRILNQETNVLDRWRSEAQPGNGIQPRALSGDASANTRPSSIMVQDASFFRLKQLSLGYLFADRLATKMGLSKLRVFTSGENLLTLTGYDGFDPEVGGENLVRGVTGLILPSARTFVFGIQAGL